VKADAVLVRQCDKDHKHAASCYAEENHPEGCYYIEWREDGKRKRKSVGSDSTAAHAARMRKKAELNARANGVALAVTPESKTTPTIIDAIAAYLAEIKISKSAADAVGVYPRAPELL
jgi:hypothetical protein